MSAPPVVELVDVAKTYAGGAQAVAGVDLAIAPGEFVSLLGPSGCGKSTVLRLIAGLSEPTAGTVRRNFEKRAADGPPIGCVFQDPTLMPWATVWDNVFLPLRIAHKSRQAARRAVDEAIALVGLTDFAAAYPQQLSGGMRMRAALARALVTHPQLLLLDEPLAALDEISRTALNDELRTIWHDRGWTALFITHSVYEAVFLSTRLLVMSPRPGRIIAQIPIDLPEPRTMAVRTSARYLELCQAASQALAAGAVAADGSQPRSNPRSGAALPTR